MPKPGLLLASVSLSAGVDFNLVTTSFRATDFVGTGTTAQAVGTFYNGISGPGNVTLVPEPATLSLLAFGALSLIRRRRA